MFEKGKKRLKWAHLNIGDEPVLLHGKNRLYPLELALLLGLCIALLAGTWSAGTARRLSSQVLRLHVVGASDSAQDQAVKLAVRDAVLAQAAPLLEGVEDQERARAILGENLSTLARAGAETAGVAVSAALEDEVWFPTKHYTGFSLPAGRYTALRITVGEGEGRNWWCVVFPPLCMGAVSESADTAMEALSPDQVALLTGENEGYVVKFKLLEWWGQLQEK